jgi:hypothetical protein
LRTGAVLARSSRGRLRCAVWAEGSALLRECSPRPAGGGAFGVALPDRARAAFVDCECGRDRCAAAEA